MLFLCLLAKFRDHMIELTHNDSFRETIRRNRLLITILMYSISYIALTNQHGIME
jgi:hypothetical protein